MIVAVINDSDDLTLHIDKDSTWIRACIDIGRNQPVLTVGHGNDISLWRDHSIADIILIAKEISDRDDRGACYPRVGRASKCRYGHIVKRGTSDIF